jgi:hypothetical protein
MARARSSTRGRRKRTKMQPALTDLEFQIPAGQGSSFIDTQLALSMTNRRLYDQGRNVAYQGLTFIWRPAATVIAPDATPQEIAIAAQNQLSSVEVKIRAAPNTWVVQNAWTKGKALWDQMQDLVLDDNPSVKGKWHDYKIRLDGGHSDALSLTVQDGDGGDVTFINGEWNLSTYVMPQHEVNPATGVPLPAVELTAVLVGPDTSTKRSLVKAYEESRSTVQSPMPNMPAGLAGSFFSLLTDSGSQEPELADVIEGENENPPYDRDNYPSGDTNSASPFTVGFAAVSAAEVDGKIGPFIAPCGLIQIDVVGRNALGAAVAVPAIDIILHVAPGMYKGTASVPMGQ